MTVKFIAESFDRSQSCIAYINQAAPTAAEVRSKSDAYIIAVLAANDGRITETTQPFVSEADRRRRAARTGGNYEAVPAWSKALMPYQGRQDSFGNMLLKAYV